MIPFFFITLCIGAALVGLAGFGDPADLVARVTFVSGPALALVVFGAACDWAQRKSF